MRGLALFLGALFFVLQYKLWIADGGVAQAWNLHNTVNMQYEENQKLRDHNNALTAEVDDLKHGSTAVEERARTDLGMIKQDEQFYQIVK